MPGDQEQREEPEDLGRRELALGMRGDELREQVVGGAPLALAHQVDAVGLEIRHGARHAR